MSLIFNQSISVLRPTIMDDPYSPQGRKTWDNPTIIPYDFLVSIQPQGTSGTSENDGRIGTVTERFMLFTQPGHDIDLQPGDRVRVSGMLDLDVVGKPMRWPDPFTQQVHHVEARLEDIRG